MMKGEDRWVAKALAQVAAPFPSTSPLENLTLLRWADFDTVVWPRQPVSHKRVCACLCVGCSVLAAGCAGLVAVCAYM
jgi:hypothetical protein